VTQILGSQTPMAANLCDLEEEQVANEQEDQNDDYGED
jgi:hypothetical protein